MCKALTAATIPGKRSRLYCRSAFQVFKTKESIPRSLLQCGTVMKEFLPLRKCLRAGKQILGVLLAILLPRANPLLITCYFSSLHVQAVPLTQLSDLASPGETFTPGSLPRLSLQPRQHLAVPAEPPVLVVLSH